MIQLLKWTKTKPVAPGWYWYRTGAPKTDGGSYHAVEGCLFNVTIETSGGKPVAIYQTPQNTDIRHVYVENLPGEWAEFTAIGLELADFEFIKVLLDTKAGECAEYLAEAKGLLDGTNMSATERIGVQKVHDESVEIIAACQQIAHILQNVT